jgi:hypothetical protein
MRALVAAVLLFGMLGCGADEKGGGDDMDAEAALNQQRAAVRGLAADLAPELAAALGGGRVTAHGDWRGCATAEIDGTYGSFQYAVQARLDVPGSPPRPYLDALVIVLEEKGFAVTVAHGRTTGDLSAELDQLTVSAREYDDQAGFVIWGVSGPCVEVAEGERDAWMEKQEPAPDVLSGPDPAPMT